VAGYRVLIKPSAVKEIESISSKRDRRRIVSRIGKLAEDPRPATCEKLSGQEKYRIRQGLPRPPIAPGRHIERSASPLRAHASRSVLYKPIIRGRYWIVYSIEDQELAVFVVKVGHRKDVYR